jgi:uncharacterized protein YndB with AHSA1/START domain
VVDIDTRAPVVARGEIEVDSSIDTIWDVLTDIDRWPRWNPDVKTASLDGPLAAGTTFRWKAGPGTITSKLERVEPPTLIAWTGTTLGIKAIHVHRLEQRGDTTLVRSEESWNGLPVRLLRRMMAKTLQNAVDSGLRYLKAEAERPAAAPDPGQRSG